MSFKSKRREGLGDVALWFGDINSDYPDFEIPNNYGPSQGRLYCHEGQFDVKGSIDGVN